jgi:hypothetical protein
MFPEYGPRTYRAPTGGAIVFSCSLLHRAMPVTRGTRFAFLPFLYDDAAAKLREARTAIGRDGELRRRAREQVLARHGLDAVVAAVTARLEALAAQP